MPCNHISMERGDSDRISHSINKLYPRHNYTETLRFYVNKDYKELNSIDPRTTILEYLRENGLTGTKLGCAEGGCGACTIVLAEYDNEKQSIKYRSANSCIMPLCSANNKQIITIEGIGNSSLPHPVQERIAKGHGSQCGFCTPGIVMSFYSLLKINPSPSLHDIEDSFDGNLCRCTGYRPILDAAKSFANNQCNSGESADCCANSSSRSSTGCSKLVDFTEFKKYDPNADLPFPKDLVVSESKDETIKSSLIVSKDGMLWIEPQSLAELLKNKFEFPHAKLIGGNSEVAIEMRFKLANYTTFINVSQIRELKQMRTVSAGQREAIEIGCNTTLSDLVDSFKSLRKTTTNLNHKSLFDAFLSNLKYFASRQIRNFATLSGNIITGSPISDLNPILMANNARLTLLSEFNGLRCISIRNFYLGYRKLDLKPDEVLVKLEIDLPDEFEIVKAYKQAKRKEDDIAIVNACFRVKLSKENCAIESLNASYGGLAPTTIYLNKIDQEFRGRIWGEEAVLRAIQDAILREISLSYSVPGGMPTYRRTLAVSFFTRFWYQCINELDINISNKHQLLNNIDQIERDVSGGQQDVGEIRESDFCIGTTNPHLSGLKQCTGEAKYLDDLPKIAGELYTGFVVSSRPHALIKRCDATKALSMRGVHHFVTHEDVAGQNLFGLAKDEEIFASKKVNYNGHLIGFILAESRNLARHAASLVEIEYEPLEPEILTIRDALRHDSFYTNQRRVVKGDLSDEDFCLKEGTRDLIIEGEMEVGGQEHFYLETQGCLVIPKQEDNEYEVYSSTQNLGEVQHEIAHALGIPANRVVARIKRIGGGFGGKESRASHIAMATAVAAKKAGRPVRCVLDRDIDMLISGARHPFYGKYKLRITRDGYFKAFDLDLINNAGHSLDLSAAVMDGAIYRGADNCYNFPKMRVTGRLAKTNTVSNTAFRGFGAPQAMIIVESMICEAADKLGMSAREIRFKNFYKENDLTHYNMPIEDWYLPLMWHEIQQYANYDQQKRDIEAFNSANRWKKRGIALLPTKFGLSFTARFLNQAGALVHIYMDGSVSVYHNGIEMGQGLNTKLVQIAANTLQIPANFIHIVETGTDKVPNSSPSAASVTSDLNGMAVMNACQQLKERLVSYRANSSDDWCKAVNAAYFDRVNLSANGFYKTPDLTYDYKNNTGRLFAYFTTGVALTSVELDVLTGDHTILRSDIYMDIGHSINYSIDIGQIEGAFVQGVGWCTVEELLVSSNNGGSLTRGPGTYKIPGFKDIPQQFNVKILRGKEYKNLNTIKSSKGIGEPPLFLGASVFFALRDAVCAARKQNGIDEPLGEFPSPCTAEILRLACGDELIKRATVRPLNEHEKLWSIRP